MAFGRKDATCPRCVELMNGAEPRSWVKPWVKKQNEMTARWNREHFKTCPICTGKTPGVCTYGEW